MIKTHTPTTRPTLAEAQEMIGGYVALAVDEPDMQILVDEDGISKELPVNKEISKLLGTTFVGNAIILIGDAMWIDKDAEEDMIGDDAYE